VEAAQQTHSEMETERIETIRAVFAQVVKNCDKTLLPLRVEEAAVSREVLCDI
jgi:hypothetical protein